MVSDIDYVQALDIHDIPRAYNDFISVDEPIIDWKEPQNVNRFSNWSNFRDGWRFVSWCRALGLALDQTQ